MSDQLQIDFDAVRACRATDPITSYEAAVKAQRFKAGHAARIVAALKQHGPMSPKEMFTFTGLSVVQIDRRRKELIDAGMVRIVKLDDGISLKRDGCEVWAAL